MLVVTLATDSRHTQYCSVLCAKAHRMPQKNVILKGKDGLCSTYLKFSVVVAFDKGCLDNIESISFPVANVSPVFRVLSFTAHYESKTRTRISCIRGQTMPWKLYQY